MELMVIRDFRGKVCTIGSLFINDQFECYTLEDVVREVIGSPVEKWKIYAKTAIPRGRYGVIITKSIRFGFETPILLDVPGFSGIRIHKGNTDKDTDGCILVGKNKDEDHNNILNSGDAFDALMPKLREVLGKGEKVYITIA
jgi:Steigviridae/Suoliviridae L,D-carboxypeptidase/transpeptidase